MNIIGTIRWKPLLVIAAGVIALAVALLFRTQEPPELPAKIADLVLVHQVGGERANKILNRMHDKDVTPATNRIGMYASSAQSAVVYLSVYRSDREAERAYQKMAHRIERGNPIFTGYRSTRIGKVETSFCVGQGQHHYFFFHNDRLYWLAADSGYAVSVAAEFLKAF
jgi:hypothetical protein